MAVLRPLAEKQPRLVRTGDPSATDALNSPPETVHVNDMDAYQVVISKPMDTKELSEFLGTPVRTLEDWRSRKPEPYGPAFWYAGKRVLYSPEDVREWIDNQRRGRGAA